MNTKILLSLAIIGAVTISAIGGTMAYFSGTQISLGNTFTAGSLDLKVDSNCRYDGLVCGHTGSVWTPDESPNAYPLTRPDLVGKPCTCYWAPTDLANQLFFDFTADPNELRPADVGGDTVSFHVDGNPAWVCLKISGTAGHENDCKFAESLIDPDCHTDLTGEMISELKLSLFRDYNCNGVRDTGDGDIELAGHTRNVPVADGIYPVFDSTTGNGPLAPASPACVSMNWNLIGAGNEIESDDVSANISLVGMQSKNNAGFKCSQLTP
jgi:hypothetical protein